MNTTRRSFLRQGAMLAGALASTRRSVAQDLPTCRVDAPCGPLQGSTLDGVRRFYGVPFAKPPVGPLRFRPAEPMSRWTELRDARNFAHAAMQPGLTLVPQSEDCLYLNVWTPAKIARPLPVFVWIHGGGFTGGYSFEPMSNGEMFASEGVVVVTVAYRLGAFGFLDVSPMLGASYVGSANNGLRDVIAALRWVKENIGAFGGDARRVTIGGESAGAKLTDLLMGVPEAQPYFHQMISESGGAERVFPRDRSISLGEDFASLWEKEGHGRADIATADAREIIGMQTAFIRETPVHFPLRAAIDGSFLAKPPIDAIAAGATKGKRLLLGTNREESATFLGPHPEGEPVAADLGNMPLASFRPIEQEYARVYPGMPADERRIRSVTAEEYWIPSLRVAEAHVRGGNAAFVYLFSMPSHEGRYRGYAFHSMELRYVWDRISRTMPAEEVALASTIHAAWLSFLKGGEPGAPGLPAWPRYDITHRPTMVLDVKSEVQQFPQREEYGLWHSFLSQ